MRLKAKYNGLKCLWCIWLWIALPSVCFANDYESALFAKANAYYAKEQYKEALKIYNRILNDGYHSAALYFNAGNASFKTGDVTTAIYDYEKAHKLAPGDDDIIFNIHFANLKTTDKVDEAPVFFLTSWWHKFMLSLSANALSLCSILLFMTASLCLIIYFFADAVAYKKVSFYLAVSLFFAGFFSLFVSVSQSSYFNNHREAIIFSNAVEIKSAPATQAKTVFLLHDGTKVGLLEENAGWVKIGMPNGNEGWLKATDVREI
jgi:tetratricopeptide (TPR) repeat protein